MNAEVENAGSEGRIAAFSRQHQTGLVTLMFTDLVGSTQLKQRMGDWLGVRRIQEHHAMVRGLLAEFSEAAPPAIRSSWCSHAHPTLWSSLSGFKKSSGIQPMPTRLRFGTASASTSVRW